MSDIVNSPAGEVILSQYEEFNEPEGLDLKQKVFLGILVILGLFLLIDMGLGLFLWVLAIILYFVFKAQSRKPMTMNYVLTNKRAIAYRVLNKTHEQAEAGACNLVDVVPVSQNKVNRTITTTQHGQQNTSTSQMDSRTIGDVVFLQGAAVRLIFKQVRDPDGIVKTIEEIKKSYYRGA